MTASPLTGLSHVQLRVSNLARSEAWYTAALGLEPLARDPDGGYVALRHRDARLVIVLSGVPAPPRPGGGPDGRPDGRPDGGNVGPLDHLAFAVSDEAHLEAWAAHLDTVGIAHPGVVLENGNPSLQLRDPDGTAVELVAGRVGGPAPA